jgi:hypothetical protein
VQFEGASRDGSKVFFTSTRKLVPGAGEDSEAGDSASTKGCVATSPGTSGCNLYLVEFGANGAHRLIAASNGSGMPQVQGVARISQDGSHIYFVAKGNLTGSAVNVRGENALEGEDNLYVYERDARYPEGHTSFIATLSAADEADWSRVDNRPVEASPDGRYLVFTSSSAPTGEGVGKGGPRQVYEYDAQTETLVRASIGASGYNNDGRTPVYEASLAVGPGSPATPAASISSPAAIATLTPEDGTVFFQSATALTPGALDNRTDTLGHPLPNTYEYQEGEVYLLTDGRDEATVSAGFLGLMGASASGRDVFFTTTDPLIQQDGNTGRDIYDASVGGGSLETPPSSGCIGEACQGQPGAPPTLMAPASTSEPAGIAPSSETAAASKSKPISGKKKPKKRKATSRKRRRGKAKRATVPASHAGRGKARR